MIIKLSNSQSVKLPTTLLKELSLKDGDFLDCIAFMGTIHLLPIRLKESTYEQDKLAKDISSMSKNNDHRIQVTLFREFNVMIDDEYYFIKNKKAKELLAYLISHNGTPFNKLTLAEILWPQTSQSQAMDNLYKVINFLKESPFTLISSRGKLQLDLSVIQCDTFLFEKYYHNRDDIECARKAIELYEGPFLFEEYYEWTATKEAFYEIQYFETLDNVIQYYENINDETTASYYRLKQSLYT